MFTSGDAGFLFCLFFFKDDLEAFYFFLDDRREDEQGDQVRDCHEGIGDIGKVPHQIEGLGSAYINDQRENNAVDHVVFMSTEEIFPSLFTVVFPAEDGGEGEEDDADSDDQSADLTDIGGEGSHGEFYAFQRLAVSAGHAEDAGGCDGDAGDGADNDGIPEGTGHIDIALTDRIISGSCCCGDSGRAHAGFIGEAAASDTETDCIHDRSGDAAEDAAADCLWIESHHENEIETMWNVLDIEDDAEETGDDIEECHGRNDNRGNFGNGLDTADDDDERKDGQDDAADFRRHAEGGMYSAGDRVCPGHVADAEGSDDSKECEKEAHDGAKRFVLEAVLHGEHRAAFHFTLCIDFAVLDREHAFTKFRGEAEAGGDPHPHESARAAGEHSGRYTDDIAGTDGRSQRCHQCGEWRYIARAAFLGAGFFGKDAADRIRQIPPGSKFQ